VRDAVIVDAVRTPIGGRNGSLAGISDGAAALLGISSETAAEFGWTPIARIHISTLAGDDPAMMLTVPIAATEKALRRSELSIDDIGAYEVNEAFAPVPLAWQAETGGTSGLGPATARRLLKEGGRVTLIDLPTADGERVAAELGEHATSPPTSPMPACSPPRWTLPTRVPVSAGWCTVPEPQLLE
jgi:Thiolase, C-terminal domain